MSERTRRPPTDSSAEALARREHELSSDMPLLDGLTQQASALDTSVRDAPQAETAQRMRNSPLANAQRKTRDMMVNSTGVAALRKTAQGMHDSTVQRLYTALPEATMAETMATSAAAQASATTVPGNGLYPEPSTLSLGGPAPIQRKLMVEGKAGRRKALFKLLGEPSGLTFNWDKKSNLVTIAEQLEDPVSPALRNYLLTVINDSRKIAKINVSPEHELTIGGFFETQELDVTAMVEVEEQAKGAGAALAIHEIWENYMAQDAGKRGGLGKYQPAHDAATRAESAVASEISGIGSNRVADAGDGRYFVIDYSSYYFVLNTHDNTAERAPKRLVGSYRLSDHKNGAVNAEGDGSLVGIARNDLTFNPMATARVVGFRKATEDPALGLQRAAAVIAEMKQGLKDDAARAQRLAREREAAGEDEGDDERDQRDDVADDTSDEDTKVAADAQVAGDTKVAADTQVAGDTKVAADTKWGDAASAGESKAGGYADSDEDVGSDEGEEEDEDEDEDMDRCYAVDGGIAADGGALVTITVTAPDGVFPQPVEEAEDREPFT